jgi:hypothetical protein
MPALNRRRDPAARDETWLIHYDDVHVGTIRMRTGVPTNVDQWGWTIGFYPVSHRGCARAAQREALTWRAALLKRHGVGCCPKSRKPT